MVYRVDPATALQLPRYRPAFFVFVIVFVFVTKLLNSKTNLRQKIFPPCETFFEAHSINDVDAQYGTPTQIPIITASQNRLTAVLLDAGLFPKNRCFAGLAALWRIRSGVHPVFLV